MAPLSTPYPLLFEPILKAKVWGGRRLSALGKTLPPDEPIGESWEIADLDSTSPSGGGGDAAHSVVRNGALAGKTIREVIDLWGAELLGDLDASHGFPLLVKHLDANTNLSVQVHPSAAYAAAHPGALLKTEAWYVVDAAPGALIYAGIREGVTPERFAHLARTGGVESVMAAIPVRPGDCYNLPSGTVHALGGGVLVAEIQTPSDTTFRLYDWGRTGRELHIEQAIECADVGPLKVEPAVEPPGPGVERLVVTEFFTIDRRVGPVDGAALGVPASRPRVLMCVRGSGRVGTTDLVAGDTALLPAGLTAAALTLDADAVALDVTVGSLPG